MDRTVKHTENARKNETILGVGDEKHTLEIKGYVDDKTR